MRGPDGWRFGVVQWPKSTQPSRLPHYFERGNSLCKVHDDDTPGYYPQLLEPDHPALKNVCKACQKKVEGKTGMTSLKFKEMIVPCPWCNAKIGEPCVDPHKKPFDDDVHIARKRSYEEKVFSDV